MEIGNVPKVLFLHNILQLKKKRKNKKMNSKIKQMLMIKMCLVELNMLEMKD